VHQNGLQSLFRSGNIHINTGLDQPVGLRDVPGADLVQAALHDLMEKSLNPIAARRQAEASRSGRSPFDSDETTAWGQR
ncbi:MAG: PH domain-containing protein, partial [Kineosporiaceae bacterium]|nr:PH domain-containing protein [Aeromicrobium sp.]